MENPCNPAILAGQPSGIGQPQIFEKNTTKHVSTVMTCVPCSNERNTVITITFRWSTGVYIAHIIHDNDYQVQRDQYIQVNRPAL